jgi:hypothetical protein
MNESKIGKQVLPKEVGGRDKNLRGPDALGACKWQRGFKQYPHRHHQCLAIQLKAIAAAITTSQKLMHHLTCSRFTFEGRHKSRNTATSLDLDLTSSFLAVCVVVSTHATLAYATLPQRGDTPT